MDNREHYRFIVMVSVIPLICVIAAMVLLWNRAFGVGDFVAFLVMYIVAGLGITVGYHRMLAHRAFKTSRPIKLAFVIAGAMAAQAPPLTWASHHRRHHRVPDRPGDPHSPYDGEEPGIFGALKGLWHAHMGWLFASDLVSDPIRYCPDLARDRDIRFLSKHFFGFVGVGLLIPALLGLAIVGTWQGMLTALLWGGPVRIFFNNQATYAINSICHYWGRRRFDTPDESRNVAWLSLLSLGESWHNNHHAFPRAASHGFRWWEVDVSAIVLRVLEKVGLVTEVIRIDRAREQRRLEGLARVGGGRYAQLSSPKPLAEQSAGPIEDTDVE